jgi:hypothetical protein
LKIEKQKITAHNELAEKLFLNKKAIEKPLILGVLGLILGIF